MSESVESAPTLMQGRPSCLKHVCAPVPTPSTVRSVIDQMADVRPTGVFLCSPETQLTWSYQELRRQSRALSHRLLDLGLNTGDKVAFMMDNGLFTAGLFLGAMYGGFVPVPLNVKAGRSQLAYMLEHSDAKVVFVSDEYQRAIEESRADVVHDMIVIRADLDRGPHWEDSGSPEACLPTVQPDSDALLIYTSGSTGQPKGSLFSHEKVLAGGWNSIIPHELSATDRSLCVLPLYHINAETVTLVSTLLTGGTVVMPHRFLVRHFWDWIADYQCTWSAIVPTIISQLLDWEDPPLREGRVLDRIRFMRSSSAPLAPSLHRAFEEKFKILLIEAMGSTECGGNIFSNPLPPGADKIGTPGRPYGFEARIVSPEGDDVSSGEPGEIYLRGPSIMKGYYKNPEGTSSVLGPDGWLRTGDLAYADEDGYFHIVGRAKELIIKGGMNIAPRQIDDVLESHPSVLEAAALGVPDHYLGEDIVAFVVRRDRAAVTEGELLGFCESQLGGFKTPARIHFVAELPKGPSGKVQRLRLSECFGDLLQVSARSTVRADAVTNDLQAGTDSRSRTPRTPVEQIIAETWAAALKVGDVGVHDNFFGLGGHSLVAIETLFQVRKQFEVGLSLNEFFANPTVAQQAALVAEQLETEGTAAANCDHAGIGNPKMTLPLEREALEEVLIRRRTTRGEHRMIPSRDRSADCPLSPAQARLWFLERLHPEMRVQRGRGSAAAWQSRRRTPRRSTQRHRRTARDPADAHSRRRCAARSSRPRKLAAADRHH